MMQTEMKLEARHSTERLVITSNGEDDNTLANFIAAVASGNITIDVIKIHFPESELFSKSNESYFDHYWETDENAKPSFHAVGIIKPKSPLLLRLEAKNKTQEKKAA